MYVCLKQNALILLQHLEEQDVDLPKTHFNEKFLSGITEVFHSNKNYFFIFLFATHVNSP